MLSCFQCKWRYCKIWQDKIYKREREKERGERWETRHNSSSPIQKREREREKEGEGRYKRQGIITHPQSFLVTSNRAGTQLRKCNSSSSSSSGIIRSTGRNSLRGTKPRSGLLVKAEASWRIELGGFGLDEGSAFESQASLDPKLKISLIIGGSTCIYS